MALQPLPEITALSLCDYDNLDCPTTLELDLFKNYTEVIEILAPLGSQSEKLQALQRIVAQD